MNRKNVSNYHRLNFTVGFSAQVICATYISNKQYLSSRSHKRKVSPRKLKRESLIFFHLSIENLVLCSLFFFFESVKISSWNYFNWLCCWRRSSPSTSSSQFFFRWCLCFVVDVFLLYCFYFRSSSSFFSYSSPWSSFLPPQRIVFYLIVIQNFFFSIFFNFSFFTVSRESNTQHEEGHSFGDIYARFTSNKR